MINILKIIAFNIMLFTLWYLFNLVWRWIFCRPKKLKDGGIKMNLPYIAESLQVIRFLGYPLFFFFILFSVSWYMCIFLIYPAYINALDIYDIFQSRNDYLILHKDYIEFEDFSKKEKVIPKSIRLYKSESYRPTIRNNEDKWQLNVCSAEENKGCYDIDLEGMNLSGYINHIKRECAYFYGEKFTIED